VIIRTATIDDVAAIAAIQRASPDAAQWNPGSYLDQDCCVADVGRTPGSAAGPLAGVGGTRASRADQGVRPTSVVVGFLVTRPTAPDEREILNLAVDAAHRRKGIARALLRHALAAVQADWYLEVRRSNVAAIELYQSLGFQQVALRPKYYSDPPETGIVMKLRS